MPLEQAFLQRLYRQIGEIFSQIAPEDQITFLNEVKGIVENPGGFHFFRLVASKKIWSLIYPLSSSYANLSNPDREKLSSLLAQCILVFSYNLKRQIAQSSSIEAKEVKTSQLESKCLAIAKDILMIKTMLRGAANTAVTIIPETFTSRGYPLSLITPFDQANYGIDIEILPLIYLLWVYKIRTLFSCSGHGDGVANIRFGSLPAFTDFIGIIARDSEGKQLLGQKSLSLDVETFFRECGVILDCADKDKDPEMYEFISRVFSHEEIKSIPDTTSRVELYKGYYNDIAAEPYFTWSSKITPKLIAIFQRASKPKLNPSDHKDVPVMKTAGQVSFGNNLLEIRGNIFIIYQILHPICEEIFLNLRRFDPAAIHDLFSVLKESRSPILPDMTIDCRFDFSKLDEATLKVLNEIITRVLSRSSYSQYLGVTQAANEASTSAAPSMTTLVTTTPQPVLATTPMLIEPEEKDKPSFRATA